MTNKMTIHRGLAELKLIDAKINKTISLIEPTGLKQKDKLVNNFYKEDDFNNDAKSKLQSVLDLIERKNKIKSAIVRINGITEVEVSGKKMKIADAINYKTLINFKKTLLNQLTQKHNSVKSKFNVENEKVNNIALQNAKIMLGRQDDNNATPTDNDVKGIMEPFVERNEYKLVNPLNIELLIDKLQVEIDDFEMEVDAVLSEINAITMIEI